MVLAAIHALDARSSTKALNGRRHRGTESDGKILYLIRGLLTLPLIPIDIAGLLGIGLTGIFRQVNRFSWNLFSKYQQSC